jgi:hypothetical protein
VKKYRRTPNHNALERNNTIATPEKCSISLLLALSVKRLRVKSHDLNPATLCNRQLAGCGSLYTKKALRLLQPDPVIY